MLTKKKFTQSKRSFGALDYLISIALFALILILVFSIFAIMLGFVFFKLPQPLKMIDIATLCSLYLATISSSFIISRKNGQKYLLCALFNALLLLLILISLSFFGEDKIFSLNFLLRLVCEPLCFLGAFLGIKREKNKKHKHKK